MLQTIAIILLILWLLGYVSSYTMGGFIHILLVVAIVLVLVRIIQGKKTGVITRPDTLNSPSADGPNRDSLPEFAFFIRFGCRMIMACLD